MAVCRENDGKLALIMYIGVVVCGQRMPEAMEMIKSALIFNRLPDKLHFLIFAEENLFKAFTEKLQDWRLLRPGEFDFEMLPLQFPAQNENVWRNLFKPCSAQRLFLPVSNQLSHLLVSDRKVETILRDG